MRILVYRLGSLGDTVVALPCFQRVRQVHPAAHITVLTNAPVSGKAAPLESILQNTGLIDDVIHYPVGLRDPRKLAALAATLRQGRFDLLVSLTAARGLGASVRDYFFFKACGIPRLIGLPFHRRDRVCQPLAEGRDFEAESERLRRRVRSLASGETASPRPDLKLTAAESSAAAKLLSEAGVAGTFVAASLGTKLILKDWGTENWQRLLAELGRAFPRLTLVLLGSPDERERSELLLAAWPGPKANLCGQASPRVSAAVLEKAALYIGHDSGPMHLAAAVGTPCVTIYSAQAPPGQWFPSGQGHVNLYPYAFFRPERVADAAYQREAINSITVDEVLAAARSFLSKI